MESLQQAGFLVKLTNMINGLYKDAWSDIITGRGITKPFQIKRRVRQGPITGSIWPSCQQDSSRSIQTKL
jgi:hypothetical protein